MGELPQCIPSEIQTAVLYNNNMKVTLFEASRIFKYCTIYILFFLSILQPWVKTLSYILICILYNMLCNIPHLHFVKIYIKLYIWITCLRDKTILNLVDLACHFWFSFIFTVAYCFVVLYMFTLFSTCLFKKPYYQIIRERWRRSMLHLLQRSREVTRKHQIWSCWVCLGKLQSKI